mmetsp:Transcript_28741/g.37089  ORF Transcript_28741/g.37089 Transcript_28741/m.37089 type:complete len:133 (-) Transcript_28741:287-685(-)
MEEDIVSGRLILMVTERMAESFVVLRHAYGLSLDDVAFFSQKVQHNADTSAVHDEALKVLRELQPFDMFLHKLANAALDRWIPTSLMHVPFEEEVAQLVKLSNYYLSQCLLNPGQLNKSGVGKKSKSESSKT